MSDAKHYNHGLLWAAVAALFVLNLLTLSNTEHQRVRLDGHGYLWEKVADSAYRSESKLRQMEEGDGRIERLEGNEADLRARVRELRERVEKLEDN